MDVTLLKQHLSDSSVKNIERWLTEPVYAEYRDELTALIDAGKWQQLEDAFFKVIEFGTGGRRGTTGVGSNRINRVTVGESAQALCLYAKQLDADAPNKGIAIAYDTRLSSPELSRYAAQVCAANGYKTYIFESFRSTPELSFAVRKLGCSAGIVITASHNPPADNGFKAYWSDGGQLVAPHDKGILQVAEEIKEIHSVDFDAAVSAGDIALIGQEIDEAYVAAASAEAVGAARDIHIVYSPLHGAGQTNVLPVLREAGFVTITEVAEQMVPDGNFPTVHNGKPNPEEPAANDMAVELMMSVGADMAITNDPDADRIGVVVRHQGAPLYLNGNQSAALATDYVLAKMKSAGTLTPKHYVAKTIVTTDLLDALAERYGVKVYGNMLVGFKYIGELIRLKEDTDEVYVIGGEESYGLLKGQYARDKDGASGALTLAECAAELKQKGQTLFDRLLEIYQEVGVYAERLDTVQCPGADGFEKMVVTMKNLRQSPPTEINGYKVTAIADYFTLEHRDLVTGTVSKIDCVNGNVVVLEFGDHRCRVSVRPSGTEPKIKFYIQWYDAPQADVARQFSDMNELLVSISKALENFLLKD